MVIHKTSPSILKKIAKLIPDKKSSDKEGFQLQTLQEIINLLPGHVYWYDIDGVFYGCNDQQAKAFGFLKSEDLVGKNLYEMMTPDEVIAHKKVNNAVYKAGEMVTAEESTETYYGGKKQVYLSKKVPWKSNKGEIIGIIGVSFDITERKKQESELAIYAQIIDSLPGHVYWKDKQGVYLGSNVQQAKSVGLSKAELVGKTEYDIISKKDADFIKKIDAEVIKTGEAITQEEPYVFKGEPSIMLSKKTPLRDNNNEIIGVLGISFDITEEKRLKAELLKAKSETESTLKNIINLIPGHVYWKDINGVYLGCNDTQAKSLGFKNGLEIVGKTDFDLPWREGAKELQDNDNYVMQHKKTVSFEEAGIFNGEPASVLSQKTPLEDQEGNIFGVLGVSIDITDRKEKERLEVENEVNKKALQEQERFKIIADQVAHDIRSPVASLLMLVKACQEIPERERIALREAATTIGDIANNLLNKYQESEGDEIVIAREQREPVLVSALLLQLLTDKKYQYQELPVKLSYNFSQKGNFAFIKIEPTALKRTISNLINNAVEALSKKEVHITLKLGATRESVKITIQDNGKGMTAELINKIMKSVPVTQDKKGGHGIGLAQVRETLGHSQGEFKIESKSGKGTKVTLIFPRTKAPNWLGEEIKLGPKDIVVILDDDASIHGAWNVHFEPIIEQYPDITLRHFAKGKDALKYIASLSPTDKRKVFLLSDYELLKQELNGLHVIEQSQVGRSMLVTSHYANALVREHAIKTGTKILPKQLASEISIKVDGAIEYSGTVPKVKKVDLVILDDDKAFTNNLTKYVFTDKMVDSYQDPRSFLKKAAEYPKDTKICIDNNFSSVVKLKGLEVAKQLHYLGFTQLYLLSGDAFSRDELPDYIIAAILKNDLEGIKAIVYQH